MPLELHGNREKMSTSMSSSPRLASSSSSSCLLFRSVKGGRLENTLGLLKGQCQEICNPKFVLAKLTLPCYKSSQPGQAWPVSQGIEAPSTKWIGHRGKCSHQQALRSLRASNISSITAFIQLDGIHRNPQMLEADLQDTRNLEHGHKGGP